MKRCCEFILATMIVVVGTTLPAYAIIGSIVSGLVGGVLIDKAGDELDEVVNQARQAGEMLIDKGNQAAKDRLDQVDAILNRTGENLIGKAEDAAANIINQASMEIRALNGQLFADLNKLVREVECLEKRTFIQDANDALGKLGDVFGTHQIRLSPYKRVRETPNWPLKCWAGISDCDPYLVDVQEPYDQTYRQVKMLMEEGLKSDFVDDNTPTHHIVGTYEHLSAFAYKTACFFPNSGDQYIREHLDYKAKADAWRTVLPEIVIE